MSILDLVETWAKGKGWWTDLQHSTLDGKEDGFLNIGKKNPLNPAYGYAAPRRSFFTLWADNSWCLDGEYPDGDDQKLEPADPDFFLNLEYLIVTKT